MEKHFAPGKIFLFFVLFVGLFMVFFVPPFQSQDEPNHFKRAYSVSVLKFFPEKTGSRLGDKLPCAMQDFINAASDTGNEVVYAHSGYKYSFAEFKKLAHYHVDSNKMCFTDYPNTARFSPASYIPQSAGIACARMFTDSVFWAFIFARIFNLLFFAVLGYYAVKSTPYLKWLFVLVLLSPMCLSLASSVSADAVLISTCALFFAKILEYSAGTQAKLSNRSLAILCLLAIVIGLTKQSILFLLFLFIIPKDKFKGNYALTMFLLVLPSLVLCGLWSCFAKSILVPLNGSEAFSHISYVIHYPLQFVILCIKSVCNTDVWLQSAGVLGWKNIYLNNFYYGIYTALLLLNLIAAKSLKLSKKQSGVVVFSVLVNMFVICVLSFCFWTFRTTFNYIEIQGRYIIPFLLPVMVLLGSMIPENSISFKEKYSAFGNILFLGAQTIYIFKVVLCVFY